MSGASEIASALEGTRRPVCRARPLRSTDTRAPRCPADRPKFLFARQPHRSNSRSLAARRSVRGALLDRHFQDHGRYPASVGLSAWGTSNMRTGGDDIAQALALIGASRSGSKASWRVTGYRDPATRQARPAARRCHFAHLGFLSRCLSRPDRTARQGDPRHRRAAMRTRQTIQSPRGCGERPRR